VVEHVTSTFKILGSARRWWLMPVILATEIKRILVRGQHEELVHETPKMEVWLKQQSACFASTSF
jgi:hypothetical protein